MAVSRLPRRFVVSRVALGFFFQHVHMIVASGRMGLAKIRFISLGLDCTHTARLIACS